MNCKVCDEIVGEDKKYATYMIGRKQVIICKGCGFKGARSQVGDIVGKHGVLKRPTLLFGSGDDEARAVAEDEGWKTTKSTFAKYEEGVWFIDQHWKMAATYYWFSSDGEWHHNVNMSVYDCFRRSCQNIRDNFGVWNAICIESTEGGS